MPPKTMAQYTEDAAAQAALEQSKENNKRMLNSEWTATKNILQSAPSSESKAEKDYYHGTNQQTVYNNIVEKRWKEEAKKNTDEWDDFFLPKVEFINNVVEIFKTQRSYVDNLDDVENNYKHKYYGLKQKVEDTGQEKKIADRLTYYTNTRDETVLYINNILWYLYLLFYLIIIILFIYKKQYGTHRSAALPIILLGFMPFLLPKILGFLQKNVKNTKLNVKYIFYILAIIVIIKVITFIKFPSIPIAIAIPIKK